MLLLICDYVIQYKIFLITLSVGMGTQIDKNIKFLIQGSFGGTILVTN